MINAHAFERVSSTTCHVGCLNMRQKLKHNHNMNCGHAWFHRIKIILLRLTHWSLKTNVLNVKKTAFRGGEVATTVKETLNEGFFNLSHDDSYFPTFILILPTLLPLISNNCNL
jgi:hypothetical protein